MLRELIEDVRAAARALWRRPVPSGVAATILAIGLSAGVAVFTYVNAFRQPFPGADARGLVQVFGTEIEDPYQPLSYLDFEDYDASADRAFEGLTAASPGYAASVRLETQTEVAFVEAVAGDYFSVLGARMALGRPFTLADDEPGAEAVAVLSYEWWATLFEGNESVVGTIVQLNYRPHVIVGVTAPDFLGSTAAFRPQVWIPFEPFRNRYTSWDTSAQNRDRPLVNVYGRLNAGVSGSIAGDELDALAAGLDDQIPLAQGPRRVRVHPVTWIDPSSRRTEQSTLRIMMVAAAGLLLLVCANVANLLLALTAGRTRELAVHSALGASPGKLARRVILENVLLAGGAGVVALLLAVPASARLGSYFARPSVWGENVPRVATIDLRVALFALGLAIATGLLAGLVPALRASRRDLVAVLRADSSRSVGGGVRGSAGVGRRPRLQDVLITVQVALSVVLLVAASLVLRTLGAARDVDLGFAHDEMVASFISTSSTSVEVSDRQRFFEELAGRISDEPWVRMATVSDNAMLSPHASADLSTPGQGEPASVLYSKVHRNYFETLGITHVQGRLFTAGDSVGTPDVAVVNEAFVRRHPGEGEPVGQQVRWPGTADAPERTFEIVGVVADAKTREVLAPPEPVLYLPYRQHNYGSGSALLIATRVSPEASVPLLYAWLREFEPHLAIINVLPYSEVVRGFLYVQRMNAELFSWLAGLGLCLAVIGVFSVTSLVVRRRTREIGVRMALGARSQDIRAVVVRQALTPVGLGLIIGLAISALGTRLVRSLLYGVEPTDPVALAAGLLVFALAALGAIYVPARRAMSVEPVEALRWKG